MAAATPPLRLLYSPASPYARKVRIVAIECARHDGIELVEAAPLSDPPALRVANPLGKVPTLVLPDGSALFDSRVICEYLIPQGSPLLPATGEPRWRVLRMQALADGMMDLAFATVMESRRPPAERSDMWLERWRVGLEHSIAAADALDTLDTPDWTLGEIALVCALGYLDLRLSAPVPWRSRAPRLAAWYDRQCARPSVAATAVG